MSLFSYPTDLGDAPGALLAELRAGNPISPHGAHAALHVVCYGMGQMYPDDAMAAVKAKVASAPGMNNTELCDCLERLANPDKSAHAVGAFPWQTLLKTLLTLLLPLLG